jgi:hypothetical protein
MTCQRAPQLALGKAMPSRCRLDVGRCVKDTDCSSWQACNHGSTDPLVVGYCADPQFGPPGGGAMH